jgi:hypothetical protein
MSAIHEKGPSIKEAAAKPIEELPESADWDDLMYRIFVRQKIDAELDDLRAGRVHSHASIREEFGLP